MRSAIFLLSLLSFLSIAHSQGYERVINQFNQGLNFNSTNLGAQSLASGAATAYTIVPSGVDVITSAVLANGTNITTTSIALTASSGYTSFVSFLTQANSFSVILVNDTFSPSALAANQSSALIRVLDFSSVAGTSVNVVGIPSGTTYFQYLTNTEASPYAAVPLTETGLSIQGAINTTVNFTPVGGMAYTIFLYNSGATVAANVFSDHTFNNNATTTAAATTGGSTNTTASATTGGSTNTTASATTGGSTNTTASATTGGSANTTASATTGDSSTTSDNSTGSATTGDASTTDNTSASATTGGSTASATTGKAVATSGAVVTSSHASTTANAMTTTRALTTSSNGVISSPTLIMTVILGCVSAFLAL